MKRFLPFYCYCILLLFLYANKGIAQKGYTVRWYSSDNNELPQSSVKAIVADKYGFIWMTTENGLVRYDGNSFLVFNTATAKLKGCRFAEILGNAESDSLYCYNEGNKELVLINQRSIRIINRKLLNGNIIKNGKRYFFHDGLPSTKTLEKDAPFYIQLPNKSGYLISTEEVELCDAQMKSLYKTSYKSKSVFNFFTLNDTLYYLKENGEFDYFSKGRTGSGKLNPEIFRGAFKLYWNAASQQVFLYSKNKIYLLSTQNKQLSATLITAFNDFDSSNIISVFYDHENQKLYLGSSTEGLCIVTFPSFRAIKRNSVKTDVYYASLPFSDNSIITSEGLVLDPEKVTDSIPFLGSRNYYDRITMAKSSNGDLWIVRKLKLFRYSKESGYKKHKQYDFSQQIKALYKDSNNTLWVCLQQDEYHKAKLYCIPGKGSGKPKLAIAVSNNINYIAQYDSNTLYLGAERGFYRYDTAAGKLFFVKNSEKINVRNILIDSDKKIWITTYEKGFFLYSGKRLHSFPKDKNNYLGSSHCIIQDKKGFFWIPTNKGLFQVSRQALLRYASRKANRIYYHHYNKADGFLTNEFNGGCQPCGNYLKSNYIAFPTMNGMVFFNPDRIMPLLPDKELFIDKVIADQKTISPKDTILLDNNFQRAKFFIDYPYYGNTNNLNIEAKLNGTTNSRWEKIGADRSISFTTLPPGSYTLIARSLSGFDSAYKHKAMTLIVPAMFYQTLWFKILCCILIMVAIIFIWHIRLYYLRVKNRQLKHIVVRKTEKLAKTIAKLKIARNNLKQEALQQERLVKSISHDIKSPLKFLAFTVRHLFDTAEIQQDEKLRQQVESIHISSAQLYGYVENLIRYSTIFLEGKKLEDKSYSLYGLIQEKILLFEKIAASGNTVIINSIDKAKHIRTNNKALSIIIHNLIDNAVKNTENGSIEVQSRTEGHTLFLTVKDSGIGMSKEVIDYYLDFSKNPALKNYHQGLHMIIELLAILKGDIRISSEINKGTTIEIMVDYI
jgi:signal transduction histidine kinase